MACPLFPIRVLFLPTSFRTLYVRYLSANAASLRPFSARKDLVRWLVSKFSNVPSSPPTSPPASRALLEIYSSSGIFLPSPPRECSPGQVPVFSTRSSKGHVLCGLSFFLRSYLTETTFVPFQSSFFAFDAATPVDYLR